MKEFDERLISEYFPIFFVDGYEIGHEIMIVSLGVNENGDKMGLSMRQGGTENTGVINSMFDDMEQRGLQKDRPILFVIDGGKAIHTAITSRFTKYFIQRCREHNKRNILDHAPKSVAAEAEKRLNEVYAELDYAKASATLKSYADWANKKNPDMSKSVLEGMEETLTVIKLKVPPLLYQSVYSANPMALLKKPPLILIDKYNNVFQPPLGGTLCLEEIYPIYKIRFSHRWRICQRKLSPKWQHIGARYSTRKYF